MAAERGSSNRQQGTESRPAWHRPQGSHLSLECGWVLRAGSRASRNQKANLPQPQQKTVCSSSSIPPPWRFHEVPPASHTSYLLQTGHLSRAEQPLQLLGLHHSVTHSSVEDLGPVFEKKRGVDSAWMPWGTPRPPAPLNWGTLCGPIGCCTAPPLLPRFHFSTPLILVSTATHGSLHEPTRARTSLHHGRRFLHNKNRKLLLLWSYLKI